MKLFFPVFILLTCTTQTYAQVKLADVIQQQPANALTGTLRPTTGMSGETVIDNFGIPESTSSSIGEPPITHWNYPDFTVYFEYDRVIWSVVHQVAK